MSKLVALCKRRGFVYPSSEIYGGMNGFWDYGPLGTALKNNLRNAWWRAMVEVPPIGPDGRRLQILGLDSSIILNPRVWKASGHADGFHDELVDCRESKMRYRADHLLCVPAQSEQIGNLWIAVLEGDGAPEALAKRARFAEKLGADVIVAGCSQGTPYSLLEPCLRANVLGPDATQLGTLTEPRSFNLMLSTSVGALQGADSLAYLRPETAQGIFINFKNVLDSVRARVPFGIAQVGKAFRNEVTPRNFIFRSREFEQMELEWFCSPESSMDWFNFWIEQRKEWWLSVGLRETNLFLRPHETTELAHYSKACTDIEYRYPFANGGFGELEGIAHRGDFDLRQHQIHSKSKLMYVDQVESRSYLPNVVEPSSGLTRGVLAILCDAYTFDETRASPEFLKLAPIIAPVKLGIFPLIQKGGMPEMAEKIARYFETYVQVQFDLKQSIGKRYARMDEIGTPLCITVDEQGVVDGTVTVRNRDTGAQERVSAAQLKSYVDDKLQISQAGSLSALLAVR
jgi:glycyl-tRNA synthetase